MARIKDKEKKSLFLELFFLYFHGVAGALTVDSQIILQHAPALDRVLMTGTYLQEPGHGSLYILGVNRLSAQKRFTVRRIAVNRWKMLSQFMAIGFFLEGHEHWEIASCSLPTSKKRSNVGSDML